MHTHLSTYLGWLSLCLALLAWAGVGYFGWMIAGEEATRASRLSEGQQASLKEAAAARAHALIADTGPEQSALEAFFGVDVISAARLIRETGASVGVATDVGSAQPEQMSSLQGGTNLSAIGFLVRGEGSFSSVMRALELFETLPMPATLERFDLQRVQDSSRWQLNLYLRVVTTTPLAS